MALILTLLSSSNFKFALLYRHRPKSWAEGQRYSKICEMPYNGRSKPCSTIPIFPDKDIAGYILLRKIPAKAPPWTRPVEAPGTPKGRSGTAPPTSLRSPRGHAPEPPAAPAGRGVRPTPGAAPKGPAQARTRGRSPLEHPLAIRLGSGSGVGTPLWTPPLRRGRAPPDLPACASRGRPSGPTPPLLARRAPRADEVASPPQTPLVTLPSSSNLADSGPWGRDPLDS